MSFTAPIAPELIYIPHHAYHSKVRCVISKILNGVVACLLFVKNYLQTGLILSPFSRRRHMPQASIYGTTMDRLNTDSFVIDCSTRFSLGLFVSKRGYWYSIAYHPDDFVNMHSSYLDTSM